MVTIRRWYIFLVAAVSLNAVAWAAISLAQDTLTGGGSLLATAFQIAVIVVGLPLFLVHWLWAERLARADPAERAATLRQVYNYGIQAGFLVPSLVSGYGLLLDLLAMGQGALGVARPEALAGAEVGEAAVRDLVVIGVLAVLWVYQQRVTKADEAMAEAGSDRTVRRLFVLIFSAVGYVLTATGSIHLLRWLLYEVPVASALGAGELLELNRAVATLIIGVPVWLVFWGAAQRLFHRADPVETNSVARKFYLYAIVFNAVIGVVANLAIILAGLLRRLLGLPALGDVREPLPIILILAVVWVYHARVLQSDAAVTAEAPRAAGVRRLYRYLVAGVGLAAALVGLGGLIGVLINAAFTASFRPDLAEAFAWFTASLIAGLPVWVLPWRRAQAAAVAEAASGRAERQSTVRKLYLYLFQFAATMTFLASAVYIAYTALASALGATVDDPLINLTTAAAYCLIAIGVWVYHGGALRGDGRRSQQEQSARLAAFKVAVADVGEGDFGRRLLGAIKRELPGLPVEGFGLTPAADLRLAPVEGQARAFELAEADLIVGPWTIAAPVTTGAPPEAAQAIAASPARKLLSAVPYGNWQWADGEAGDLEGRAALTARAVRQVLQGEEVGSARQLSTGTVVAIVLGVLVFIFVVLPIVFELIASGGV